MGNCEWRINSHLSWKAFIWQVGLQYPIGWYWSGWGIWLVLSIIPISGLKRTRVDKGFGGEGNLHKRAIAF